MHFVVCQLRTESYVVVIFAKSKQESKVLTYSAPSNPAAPGSNPMHAIYAFIYLNLN